MSFLSAYSKIPRNMIRTPCFLVSIIMLLVSTNTFSQSLSEQLYTFDFGLTDLPIPERTRLLSNLGYKGLVFNVNTPAQQDKLQQYLQTEELQSGTLTIPVIYYGYSFSNGQDQGVNPRWKEVMNAIPAETDMWLIINAPSATPQKLRTLLTEVSEEAVRLGKDVVIYPHDNNFIEGVEDIIPYLEDLNLENIYVTFHLCHELREMNRDRLREVFEAANPYLKYVSISGALNTINPNASADWRDAIRPLDDSELDLLELVKIFEDFEYNGPVVLHTFGINRAPEDHLASSIRVWKAMTDRIEVQGNFEAEDFALASGNVDIENTPNTNGGQNLGFIRNDDYVDYYIEVLSSSEYNFQIHASSLGAGGTVEIYTNNEFKGSVSIPVNGAWHMYESYKTSISLDAGSQKLRLVFIGGNDFLFNIDAIQIESNTLSIEEIQDINTPLLYPNPVKDLMHISATNSEKTITVYDLLGAVKISKLLDKNQNQIDLSDLADGIYLIKIINKERSKSEQTIYKVLKIK